MVAAAKLPSVWELAAEDILSTMLREEGAAHRAFFDYGVRPAHMPSPQAAALFTAIMATVNCKEPLHDTTVRSKCESVVSLEWYAQVYTLYDPTRSDAFESNCKIVRKHGMDTGFIKLLTTAVEQVRGGKMTRQSAIESLMTVMSGFDAEATVKNETAYEQARLLDAFFEGEPKPLVLTGIPWVDENTGGFDLAQLWLLAAPYKSRKSTVMLNIALSLLMNWITGKREGPPPSIGIMSGEMLRIRVNTQLIAMLAIAYLIKAGWYELAGESGTPLNLLSARLLKQAQSRYKSWDKAKVKAIDWAREQHRQFNNRLRVYDSTPEGGALNSFASLERMMLRDRELYKGTYYFIDYFQLFAVHDEGTYFERVSGAALGLQRFVKRHNISAVLLAQQNEDAIKNGSGYSAGVKGGGDATAAAEFVIESRYRTTPEMKEDDLSLKMKHSREDRGGDNTGKLVKIHPGSGLILDSTWIKRLAGV